MSRHSAPRARTSGRVRPSTVGLLAAAMTPLVAFGIAPAFAGTSTADTADAAGDALGLDDVLGSLPGDTPVVDVDIPDVCLDLSAKVDKAQADLDAAPGNVALQGVLATAKLALGDCVDKATEPTTEPTTTTPTPTTSTAAPTSTTSLPPLGGALGGTEPGTTSTSTRIPADSSAESQADRQGSNTQVVIPRGAADTGDGSLPDAP